MEALIQDHTHLKSIDLEAIELAKNNEGTIQQPMSLVIPQCPAYFKIAELKGISDNVITLDIPPNNIPTCVCGDACAVNLKGNRLLEETYGFKCPFSRCGSHASAETIRRLCTSKTMCQDDAKSYMKI